MTHLFYVRFSGDEQGTVLERELKKIVRQDYTDSVCTEAAVEGIFEQLCRECQKLSELYPRCKAVRVRLDRPAYGGDGYRIYLDRKDNGCNCGNNALLYFRMLSAYFLHSDETLFSIADDHACEELSENLSVYNI